MMLRTVAFVLLAATIQLGEAKAQAVIPSPSPPSRTQPASQCQAIAQAVPRATFASVSPVEMAQARVGREEVKITFIGHSTYQIESPDGVVIATDFSGYHTPKAKPDVVTMNKAHSTHFTLSPDPAIAHVLHGWSDVPGERAEHHVTVADSYIRNVTTDIRGYGGFEENGNSIFIFEIAGLCIGHLGHLHHELTDTHYAEIGRLDVLMVPTDGGLTMGADSMSRVVQRLRSSLILPMHRGGPSLDRFLAMFDSRYDIVYAESPTLTVSLRSLPRKPRIVVPAGL
ncbi:L-ascorbate metabolism protein UlaG (beta-lactamase superfamily) [Neorhizobium galegae]|uniref:MBL fold metallo-hydrolase n=1 Tax=Neorhizobium galegae TaxID=399 RepID=UPI001AE85EE9|nr:MBL fold metallo-hydrolase [Neorhizobium galegae]MBP2550120.1 L-ascorbate metabolism protein UlaG (beta-lactamase superfamily) [Neorhizobium galegae]